MVRIETEIHDHLRPDRIRPAMDQSVRTFRSEFPSYVPGNYRWEYPTEATLSQRLDDRSRYENQGVIDLGEGTPVADILLPKKKALLAQGGSDPATNRLLLPLGVAYAVSSADFGKLDQRDKASELQTQLFLEATSAMLDDNRGVLDVDVIPETYGYYFDNYFYALSNRADAQDLSDPAAEFITHMIQTLEKREYSQYGLVISGMRATALFGGVPLFTINDPVDTLVQKMIANQLKPQFIKRMDQKYVWFRKDAAKIEFYVPDYEDDDPLVSVCKRFGYETDSKQFIESYLNGDLAQAFYAKMTEPYMIQAREDVKKEEMAREERFREVLQDEEGKNQLAAALKHAMLGSQTPEQIDYSGYESEEPHAGEEDFEQDPEIIRREQFVRGKRSGPRAPLEG